ncbi:MAG TPA: prohibitin family protein [Bacteriovoracaceae bacterium]|nr:prohibitin family protein [Bacteriovoracaceae bacterium]
MDPKLEPKMIALGALVLIIGILVMSSSFVIPPGHRGVLVTMGKVSKVFAPEGFGLKSPFITDVLKVSVRQQTKTTEADCYSSDLQQIKVELRVLYRIPESMVVRAFQDYSGDPFDSLIAPRVTEALKEVTALQSAEQIVKKREEIKSKALAAAKAKIGNLIVIEDIVIQNVALSKELESAIEAKMVQEQEAAKAKFIQQKSEIEANTAIIKAKGEAEAIRVRGRALQESPGLVQLQIVEKWNGVSPLVIGAGGSGANIILPIKQ